MERESRPTRKILRHKAAQKKIGVGNTHYHGVLQKDPTFPRDVVLGKRARGKFEDELDEWLESRRVKTGGA